MNRGICLLSSVPIRAEASSKSEMVSMLLFGETAIINEKQDEWLKITTEFDQYTGWVNEKHLQSFTQNIHSFQVLSHFPISKCKLANGTAHYLIPGSTLPNFENNACKIDDAVFSLDFNPPNQPLSVSELAKAYLNTPYLWGGRSLFGIDCSGLTQIVYKIAGYRLLRDAKDQATQGTTVNFRNEIKPGDLAFFDNGNGVITHVGLMLNEDSIIHASGKVRIDMLDDHGIYNKELNTYTHKLRIIKRII